MNTKTIVIVLIAVIILASGAFAFTQLTNDKTGTQPFNTTNQTPTENTDDLPDGIEDNTVTQKAIALSSLELSQKRVTIQMTTNEQSQTIEENTVYTLEKSHKVVRINNEDTKEYYYNSKFTAIQEFQNNGYELSLQDPQNQISHHTKEPFLRATIQSIPLTLTNQTTENGTKIFHFSGDQVTTSERSELAQYFRVDSITSVDTVQMKIDENGIIKNVTLDIRVSDETASYPITRQYSVKETPNANISKPDWVQEAVQTNAGMNAYIVSDKELILQHKFGRTIQQNDTITIQTPTGKIYTKTVTDRFGPNDQVVLTRENASINMTVNPNSSIENGSDYLSESGTYIITIRSQNAGLVSLTTVEK